jgi:zinc transport system permease protein
VAAGVGSARSLRPASPTATAWHRLSAPCGLGRPRSVVAFGRLGGATLTADRLHDGDADVERLVALTAVVGGVALLFYRRLLYTTFDEAAARVAGVDVTPANRLLVVLTALVVVGAMQMLGVILFAAMLVVPVAAAAQVARSFRESILVAVVAGQLSVLVGTTLSYTYGVAAGGTIVLLAIALYLLAAALGRAG